MEADLERTGLDLAVPIDRSGAESKVPLPDHAGVVTGFLEDRGQRGPGRAE